MKKVMLTGLLLSAVGSISPDAGSTAAKEFFGSLRDFPAATGRAAAESVAKYVALPYVVGRIAGEATKQFMPCKNHNPARFASRVTVEAGSSALAMAALMRSPWAAYIGAGMVATGATGMYVSE